jgi:alpha-L-rhamnosidase
MTINNLRVNHVENPLGFNLDKMSLSWNTQADGEEKFAKSTRVCVSCGDENIYDSGDRENADSRDFRVELNLKPRTKYNWTVEVTADNGEQAKAESSFETGKLNETWKADWISPIYKGKEIAPILEKSFDLKDDFEIARLYICGLGLYEVYINGEKAGDEFLAPGYHSYDFHLQAQTIDVSNLLHKGENLVQIYLGDGWFKGRLGFDGGFENIYGDSYYAICELYADDKLVCVTDESWKWKDSPIVFSNIYDGEIYDSNLENFTQTADLPVKIRVPEKCGVLCDRYSLPIVEKERFYPISVIETPKNEIVLDFGQNMTGWVVIHGEIPAGVILKLTASEIMQDGCFYHDNFRIAKTEFTYHSNGKNTDVRPHFTFYGFRYMKLEVSGENASKYSVNPMNFEAVHLRSDFDEIGKIVTGHSGVNKLFENAMWSQKDNFLDVPTDCPQRDERLGWTGDAQVFSETACMNMYVPAFFRKYLWDMRAEQGEIGGAVPNVVPRLKKGMVAEFGSCPWADAGVIIPWNVYQAYGDKTLLEECYPGMKAWIEYEKAQEEKIGGKHLVKDGFHFADWLALDHDGPEPFGATNPLYIASAYYYYCTNCLAKSAEILGYKEDFEKYSKFASEILSAVRETYFDENGLCKSETQTGSALAIMFGLNPDEESKAKEGEVLNARVAENNGYLNTGFVGTPLLCGALSSTGHNDTAVSLLLNEDMPSWLYEVNMGATTIWERWNSVNPDGKLSSEGMNSLNHYSYGSIVAWMYKDLVGIKASEAGYKRVKIEPKTDARLGFADCTMKTASGEYKVSWKYEGKDKVSFKIHVPFDCAAEFSFGNFNENFSCGNYNFNVKM